MKRLISDQTIAILAENGVSQDHVTEIRETLEKAGTRAHIVSSSHSEVKTWKQNNWGIRLKVDVALKNATPEDYAGVIIPGGQIHADRLREKQAAIQFVCELYAAGKIVAAVCHGVQLLINAEVCEGRRVSGPGSLKSDLVRAGAFWADDAITQDNGLITVASDQDIPAFTETFLDILSKGLQQRADVII